MIDIILILVLVLLAAAIVFYLVREKKRGAACVGCPHAKQCAAKQNGCGCSGHAVVGKEKENT